MNARAQIICSWCGILCPIFMFIGLWPATDFFPPHLPTASAADIAAIYQQNTNAILIGAICGPVTSEFLNRNAGPIFEVL